MDGRRKQDVYIYNSYINSVIAWEHIFNDIKRVNMILSLIRCDVKITVQMHAELL